MLGCLGLYAWLVYEKSGESDDLRLPSTGCPPYLNILGRGKVSMCHRPLKILVTDYPGQSYALLDSREEEFYYGYHSFSACVCTYEVGARVNTQIKVEPGGISQSQIAYWHGGSTRLRAQFTLSVVHTSSRTFYLSTSPSCGLPGAIQLPSKVLSATPAVVRMSLNINYYSLFCQSVCLGI